MQGAQSRSSPPAPVRDASSLKAVRYGPGHEKFPSWPAPAAPRTLLPSGSCRSKSWTDQTHYPKEQPPVISRPFNKRLNPSFSQQVSFTQTSGHPPLPSIFDLLYPSFYPSFSQQVSLYTNYWSSTLTNLPSSSYTPHSIVSLLQRTGRSLHLK